MFATSRFAYAQGAGVHDLGAVEQRGLAEGGLPLRRLHGQQPRGGARRAKSLLVRLGEMRVRCVLGHR